METVNYEVELRLNGQLIGDVRRLATGLNWTKRRTATGVDSISFNINDRAFAKWCEERSTTIAEMLTPYALDCRIVRNGEPLIGGYLAATPAYTPSSAGAQLTLNFDGYLNLLEGVYIRPTPLTTASANNLVAKWINDAETRSANAGKAFGLYRGRSDSMATIQRTFDNYKTVKSAVCDLCNNVDGAGPFDVVFDPDRRYNIVKNLGRTITDWKIHYPAMRNAPSAISISGPEVTGFASKIIALGSGETSSDPTKSTVVVAEAQNDEAVAKYGYVENLVQYSSISSPTTLSQKAATDLANASSPLTQPEVTLLGSQIPPSSTDEHGIWIGDRVEIANSADFIGQTNGWFRINELSVSVSAANVETITPTLERWTNAG